MLTSQETQNSDRLYHASQNFLVMLLQLPEFLRWVLLEKRGMPAVTWVHRLYTSEHAQAGTVVYYARGSVLPCHNFFLCCQL
jgi:hypothetical protein